MKAKDKPRYVKEVRVLYKSVDVEKLIDNPNDLEQLGKINRIIAIFTNFSHNDGVELKRLLTEFQKWARAGKRLEHIRNCATDMMQFISQGVEGMDVYVIDNLTEKQKRVVDELKNENLWVRASSEGKDLHIQIGERGSKSGEHVHFIVDDTGEVRIDRDDQSPSNLIEKVVSVTTKEGSTVGVHKQGVKTTLEFFDETPSEKAPLLFTTDSIRRSGGPKGHFIYFPIKNIGKETAIEVRWEIRGFAYSWVSKDIPFELDPGVVKEVEYPISHEVPFTNEVPELNIVMEYRDAKGRRYFTRRDLKQEKVPSGAFYTLRASTFHSPSIVIDDGLDVVSEPTSVGDRCEVRFKVNTKEGVKTAKIGISRTFLSVWGFSEEKQIKQALLELGHRKMRNMVKSGNFSDYIFITSNFPTEYQNGFEGYQLLRDSLDR